MIAKAPKKSTTNSPQGALNHNRDLLTAFGRAAQSIQRARTAEDFYRAVGDEIKSLGCHVNLLMINEDRRSLSIAYLSYAPKLIRKAEKLTGLSVGGYPISFSPDSFYGRIMAGGKAVFFDQASKVVAETIPEALHLLIDPLVRMFNLSQGILAPLRVDDQPLGFIKVNGSFLNEDDVPAIEFLAGQIAVSLYNVRLMQKLQGELDARKQAEEALRASEAKNLALLNAIPDMIFIQDHKGDYLNYYSPGKQQLYAPPESFLGKNIRDVMPPQMAQSYLSIMGQAIQSGESQLFDYALDLPDGRKYFEAHIVAYQDSKILSVIRDMTGRRQAERELSRQFEIQDSLYQMTALLGRTNALDDVYEAALNSLQVTLAADRVSILLFDEEGVMRFKAWHGLSDAYRKAADGHSPWKPDARDPQPVLVPDVQTEPNLASLRSVFSNEGIGALGFIPLIHQGRLLGKFMIYYNSPHIFLFEEVQLAQTIASHVAFSIARKQAEEELLGANKLLEAAHHELRQSLAQEQVLARTDGLTALYNRRYFFELAVREFNASIRYQRPMTIILFDVDGFKQINDSFGHLLGDAVLRQVAQVAATQVRDVDILARYGGDEFIILLPETNAQQAFLTAERVRLSVEALSVETDNDPLMVTLSIGIAELVHSPRDGSVEDVIRKADKALYRAKKSGRNHTIIHTEI